MADFRTLALEEIASRIVRDREVLDLQSFNWNSNDPDDKSSVPSIYMFEGRDVIKTYSSRGPLGYPARRHLEINIEVVAKSDRNASEIKALLRLVKRSVFCDRIGDSIENYVWTPNEVVANNSFIKELRTKGPGTYAVPELVGIKLVIGLWYTDLGFL